MGIYLLKGAFKCVTDDSTAMVTTQKTKKKASSDAWYINKEVYYLCQKCYKWFLLKNFDIVKHKCKNCAMKEIL
mgnify:CR=1 FL=1